MYDARLTFDDGPSRYTAAVLTALERHGLRGIFFVVGCQVRRQASLVRRASAAGHTVGNHSWDHPHLTALSSVQIESQITRTSEAIAEVLGQPPRLFRPPYGDRDARVDAITARLGLSTMLWDVDPQDWAQPGAQTIAEAVAGAGAGQIVLLHDGRGNRSQTVTGLQLGLERVRR